MPDVGPFEYIITLLYEIGPYNSGFNGPEPISWQDIDAWNRVTRYGISPREAKMVRSMSSAMVSASHEAKNPNMPPPYAEIDESAKIEHGEKIASAFRAFAKVVNAGKKSE